MTLLTTWNPQKIILFLNCSTFFRVGFLDPILSSSVSIFSRFHFISPPIDNSNRRGSYITNPSTRPSNPSHLLYIMYFLTFSMLFLFYLLGVYVVTSTFSEATDLFFVQPLDLSDSQSIFALRLRHEHVFHSFMQIQKIFNQKPRNNNSKSCHEFTDIATSSTSSSSSSSSSPILPPSTIPTRSCGPTKYFNASRALSTFSSTTFKFNSWSHPQHFERTSASSSSLHSYRQHHPRTAPFHSSESGPYHIRNAQTRPHMRGHQNTCQS